MNTIRVTGGNLKGRLIRLAPDYDARYTSSRVREAIFNMLGDLSGRTILDLFSGAGSLAIEALSRGAAEAVCVELDRSRATLLNKNLEDLGLDAHCRVLEMDVTSAIPFLSDKGARYDIIFVDPPYARDFLAETVSLLERNVVYHKSSIIVIEHSKREQVTLSDRSLFHLWKARQYGDTSITLLLQNG